MSNQEIPRLPSERFRSPVNRQSRRCHGPRSFGFRNRGLSPRPKVYTHRGAIAKVNRPEIYCEPRSLCWTISLRFSMPSWVRARAAYIDGIQDHAGRHDGGHSPSQDPRGVSVIRRRRRQTATRPTHRSDRLPAAGCAPPMRTGGSPDQPDGPAVSAFAAGEPCRG